MKLRLLKALCYLGFAPELWLVESRRNNTHPLQQHIQNGLALILLLTCLLLFCSAVQLIQIVILMNSPVVNIAAIELMDVLSFGPLFVWAVLSIIGQWRAFHKSTLPIPLVSRLATNKAMLPWAICSGFILQFLFISIAGISLRANYLARPHSGSSSVYMLYENMNYYPIPNLGTVIYGVPEWFFPIGFYPIAETSAARWGDGSITVEPLTRGNLTDAFQNGRFVFVASHGGNEEGTISLPDNPNDDYSPADIKQGGGAGPNLQFVYIASCNAGNLENQWIASLAPAKVLLYGRVSWIPEHVYWLWFKGPKVVSELK
jgi:hypothetical protein